MAGNEWFDSKQIPEWILAKKSKEQMDKALSYWNDEANYCALINISITRENVLHLSLNVLDYSVATEADYLNANFLISF